MLQATRGIIFKTVKYSESSIIAKIYTEQSGLQSYMVRGLRSKKSTIRQALFQALTPVELVAYHREKKELQNLKEIKVAYPFVSIPFDIKKSTILLFLNEVLYQVIREEESNPDLFNFIFNAIIKLDKLTENNSVFHLVFLVQLTRFLGFYPFDNFSEQQPNFDLTEGRFTHSTGPDTVIAISPYSNYISSITKIKDADRYVPIPSQHRRKLLEILLNYYRHHVP
ncbi:MAG: DNA repair protein RecO, partial [Bacteroidales bacterium]|nr:DNA repair protein RecO [Bacteroidales bacterium]